MKKYIALALVLVLALGVFAACGAKTNENTTTAAGEDTTVAERPETVVIAVPNDTTNEARALLLLEDLGYIKLKEGAGITATKLDIEENPFNIEIKEVEAAQIPNMLQDTDFSVINSNYAIAAGIDPKTAALAQEGAASAYANILAVKEGNENEPKILALKAALESRAVADFIDETYGGSVVGVVENPGDGFNAELDYEALKGETIKVAASPAPHCEILAIAKDILAQKGINLEVKPFTDYVQPNMVVEDGQCDANYFQHVPYLDDFNAQNGTHVVSVAAIHVEPMGIYGGKQTTLDILK